MAVLESLPAGLRATARSLVKVAPYLGVAPI